MNWMVLFFALYVCGVQHRKTPALCGRLNGME